MTIEFDQIPTVAAGEVRNGKISLANLLDSGESLSGTPTIVELGSTDLTISSVGKSTGTLEINGVSVTSGHAVVFKATGFVGPKQYRLKVTADTNSTPAQTLVGIAKLVCEPST